MATPKSTTTAHNSGKKENKEDGNQIVIEPNNCRGEIVCTSFYVLSITSFSIAGVLALYTVVLKIIIYFHKKRSEYLLKVFSFISFFHIMKVQLHILVLLGKKII